MQTQEKQIIDQLFKKLNEISTQSGPRDPQVEALIDQHMQRIPGAAYYMAQAVIVQYQALKQAETQLKQPQQRARSMPQQPAQQTRPQQGGGFLAGAAQTALGIGGGILIANAGMALADSLFGDRFDEVDLFDSYEAGLEDATFDLDDGISDMDMDFDFDDW